MAAIGPRPRADSTSDEWRVDLGDGDVDGDNKTYSQFVWPVRSSRSVSFKNDLLNKQWHTLPEKEVSE